MLCVIKTIIDPSLTLPLINTQLNDWDIQPIVSILYQMTCSKLGQNQHFPRALLYGSTLLGGMDVPTTKQQATKHQLNYFLYNIHFPSSISQNFDASSFSPISKLLCSNNFSPFLSHLLAIWTLNPCGSRFGKRRNHMLLIYNLPLE